MMGHVNNAVYLTYFENARAGYWTALGGREGEWENTYVLVRAECDYRSPANHAGPRSAVNIRLARFGQQFVRVRVPVRDGCPERADHRRGAKRAGDVRLRGADARGRSIDEFRERVRRFEKRPIEGIETRVAEPRSHRPGAVHR